MHRFTNFLNKALAKFGLEEMCEFHKSKMHWEKLSCRKYNFSPNKFYTEHIFVGTSPFGWRSETEEEFVQEFSLKCALNLSNYLHSLVFFRAKLAYHGVRDS